MSDGIRRKLPSLQPQIEAYSIKAWYTVPAARTVHGVDPNAPREPMKLETRFRLAARVVDERLGGNPANMGVCDCVPCGCELRGVDGSYVPCEHDLACPHFGEETAAEVSLRLLAVASRVPGLAEAILKGADAVYELAGLTDSETQVARYQHQGTSRSSIATITNRQDGTVNALLARAHFKLRELAKPMAGEVAA